MDVNITKITTELHIPELSFLAPMRSESMGELRSTVIFHHVSGVSWGHAFGGDMLTCPVDPREKWGKNMVSDEMIRFRAKKQQLVSYFDT